ncbi:hypothetical protein SERLADRAFT_438765 [Serpula lacrymans var. lacrymans S7.9]|uniref:Protein kinase domain-containing protein n=1 Tax=Serpula lacrymans var. lacrymans (strain S7.9) TaxID=578457 RepID=F8P081_SERL9|nr:uncharacterized protein SERLADRAFT_438765 [Serpula lacrymans var. lacrymans S7.9]EGO23454.1 hypothetical protein SERLADRAFT_438765 [Serpula lacrymans var. lacrymans S7.9]
MYSAESAAHLAYSSRFLPQGGFLSHSLHEDSIFEGLPLSSPWGSHSDDLRTSTVEEGQNSRWEDPPDLEQSLSRQLLAQDRRSPADDGPLSPFSQGDEVLMSPAAMFLSAFSPPAPSPLLPDSEGSTISGYELGPIIGYGGFSTIRRASSPSGGTVAVKIVRRSDLAKREDPSLAQKRLDHEASVWASLSHEHILPLFSTVHTSYADFFITLLCPAGSLFDILKRDGRPALPHDDAGMMFRQVVRGLRYLHEVAGYVHRDIKLENVLVDEMGVCRIGDFGMARKIGELDDGETAREDGNHSANQQHSSTFPQPKRQSKANLPVHLSLIRHHGGPRHRTSTPVGASAVPTPTHPVHVFQTGSLPYAAPELLSPQLSPKSSCVYEVPTGVGRGAERVLQGCLERSVRGRWTIAMVDEMAWGVGWGEVDDTSVSHEDEFEIIDHPSQRSASHSNSRSRPRMCRDKPLDASKHARANRSLSRASVVTSNSCSTRSTSRSVSRPPPARHIQSQTYDALSNSIFSTTSSLSSLTPYENTTPAIIAPTPSSHERGRKPKKTHLELPSSRSPSASFVPATPTDLHVSDRFSVSMNVPEDPSESEFSREASRGRRLFGRDTEIYAGSDTLDNTARWALRHGMKRGYSAGPSDVREESIRPRGHERLRSFQLENSLERNRRAESTPPAPSLWPVRSRTTGKEVSNSVRFPDVRGFLRDPSATPIPIPMKNNNRSRSIGV